MGFINNIAKKLLNKDEYDDFSLTASMDGCEGESKIARIKEIFKKIIPC